MRDWDLEESPSKICIGAVSYLNTVPLVWGMLHGPQREQVELSFSIPSTCAEHLERGRIQIGLVPVAEIARQGLDSIPGLGISCFGPVRSILLFSRVPWREVRTMAADLSSRTSVQLARIILRERYGAEPRISPHEPILSEMLASADAALLIGDPALRIEPEQLSFDWLDLGAEWLALTGLPMVFATWAGKPGVALKSLSAITHGSYQFGKARLAEIVEREHRNRQITKELAERYLRQHIHFEIGAKEEQGLQAFLELANLGRPDLVARI